MRPGSPAEEAGIAAGDIILEVNRRPATDIEKLSREIHSLPAGKDILLLVWSHGGASYRVLHPDQKSGNGM